MWTLVRETPVPAGMNSVWGPEQEHHRQTTGGAGAPHHGGAAAAFQLLAVETQKK
jgi:hypothetical protein